MDIRKIIIEEILNEKKSGPETAEGNGMNRYEIEIKTSRFQPGEPFYVYARTEGEALRKAKEHAKRTLSATAFRYASYIFA